MASVFDEQRGRLCTVCYHQYSCHGEAVPRILTCGHSFCTGCLGRLLGQLAHGHIRCPTCKGDTLVPGLSNDIHKLSKNFGVLEILESMEEAGRAGSSASDPVPLCTEHDNEPMKVYCVQEDQLICIYCQVYGAHQGHQCQLVTALAEEGRKTLRSFVENLSSQKDSMVAVSQAVNDTVGAVQAKEDRLMYEVTRHFEILRRKLYQRESQVKILLRNRTSAKTMLLDKQKRKLQDLIGKVDQLTSACQAALSGPDYELVQQKTKLEGDFHSLSVSIEMRDLRPCIKDDLHCHLDPSMLVQVASHGMLVKEPAYTLRCDAGRAESVVDPGGTSSGRVDSPVSEPMGSAGDANRQEGDFEHLEWPAEMPVSGRTSRQQSSSSDVIIIYDDTDLEAAAGVGGGGGGAGTQAASTSPQPQTAAGCCQASGQHACTVLSAAAAVAGAAAPASSLPTVVRQGPTVAQPASQMTDNRHRSARSSLHPHLRRLHNCLPNPLSLVCTSSSEDSGDGSEPSDMELDRPLRSAWTNRSGWSAASVNLNGAPSQLAVTNDDNDDDDDHDHAMPDALLEGAAAGGVGHEAETAAGLQRSQPAGSAPGRREEEVEVEVEEEEEEDDGGAAVVVSRCEVDRAGTGEVRAVETDPWVVNESASASPRRSRRQGHASSQHPRFKGGLLCCSVHNCTSTNCSFYVHCRNCSRVFCPKCVSTSISARRCYKRPRGHSFMYIPLVPGNVASSTAIAAATAAAVASSGSSSPLQHHHQHHHHPRMHHRLQHGLQRCSSSNNSSNNSVVHRGGQPTPRGSGAICASSTTAGKTTTTTTSSGIGQQSAPRSRECQSCLAPTRSPVPGLWQVCGTLDGRPNVADGDGDDDGDEQELMLFPASPRDGSPMAAGTGASSMAQVSDGQVCHRDSPSATTDDGQAVEMGHQEETDVYTYENAS